MNQLSRLISILTILKSKRLITGNTIAKKFDVSLRTVYRDIKKLEEAGVPIITEEGRGYSIMEGYSFTPVQLQEEEVNALITAEKIISNTKDEALIANFENALVKIKSTFQSGMQMKTEMLDLKMFVLSSSDSVYQNKSLSSLQLAMTNFHKVKIRYQKAGDIQITEREIEPAAIYGHDEKWIVIAWCHLRNEYRHFRLDRILEFKILNSQFDDRKFDLQEYFRNCPYESMRP